MIGLQMTGYVFHDMEYQEPASVFFFVVVVIIGGEKGSEKGVRWSLKEMHNLIEKSTADGFHLFRMLMCGAWLFCSTVIY